MLSIKTTAASILSAFILLFSPLAKAEAQEIRTLKDYLDNCIQEDEDNIPEECKRLKKANEIEENEAEEEEEEEEKSGGIGGYAGVSLGVAFPDIDEDRPIFQGDDVDIDAGFSSSLYAGIRFSRFLGADLEFAGVVGELDSDLDEDQNYFISGVFLNSRFTLPLNNNKNSLSLFLSPGIGVSQLSSSLEDEIDSDIPGDDDDFDRTTFIEDDTRFTWQIKGGISIPISSKFSIIPQLRYVSQTGDNAVDYFGTDVGVKFDF
ncbi:MAG: outer membrane beta-barrel protein [Cyanobacteria bacterium P01_G01_bin.19]